MRLLLLLLAAALPAAFAAEPIPLFDGKTLTGWTPLAEGHVVAKDGEIQILSQGKNLWLLHDREFTDFELTVECLMPDDNYNSGIGFRCTPAGDNPKGYQCEVANQESGMLYAIGSGWVWPKDAGEKKKFAEMSAGAFKPKEWNTFRIVVQGDHIRLWLNGTLTADLHDARFTKGRIALQHHGKGALHRFRNILLKEL